MIVFYFFVHDISFISYSLRKAWWRMGSFSPLRSWNGCDQNGNLPWKATISPIRWIPGADNPAAIKIDLAHTFSMGFAKDFCASSIILLSHIGIFGGGAIDVKLDYAFSKFREWVHNAKQTCKISEFSLKSFKITSLLAGIIFHNYLPKICFPKIFSIHHRSSVWR